MISVCLCQSGRPGVSRQPSHTHEHTHTKAHISFCCSSLFLPRGPPAVRERTLSSQRYRGGVHRGVHDPLWLNLYSRWTCVLSGYEHVCVYNIIVSSELINWKFIISHFEIKTCWRVFRSLLTSAYIISHDSSSRRGRNRVNTTCIHSEAVNIQILYQSSFKASPQELFVTTPLRRCLPTQQGARTHTFYHVWLTLIAVLSCFSESDATGAAFCVTFHLIHCIQSIISLPLMTWP